VNIWPAAGAHRGAQQTLFKAGDGWQRTLRVC
jgi:hypothetical protein